MPSRLCTLLAVAVAGVLLGGCADECRQLADVICQCEPTLREREACRVEIEAQQQRQAEPPTEEQRQSCGAALETCTCEALEQNRTDQCGYQRPGGS